MGQNVLFFHPVLLSIAKVLKCWGLLGFCKEIKAMKEKFIPGIIKYFNWIS